jgi:hypothetical protein
MTIASRGAPVGGRNCYEFRVENVHLASTLDRGQGPGVNELVVSAAEVPFDAPDAEPLLRFARVEARLVGGVREPVDGELEIEQGAFGAAQPVPAPSSRGFGGEP